MAASTWAAETLSACHVLRVVNETDDIGGVPAASTDDAIAARRLL
jgi:hypothetical protein